MDSTCIDKLTKNEQFQLQAFCKKAEQKDKKNSSKMSMYLTFVNILSHSVIE